VLGTVSSKAQSSDQFELRPTLGIGAGVFAFYGDVGERHKEYSPMLSRFAYELRATSPINQWLEGGIYVLQGSVGANERSLTRNLNFESKITTGGLFFSYNFHHLLPADRTVEPYLSLGIESMEFLSKTDLYDAQGRRYHYWSDGTIRDVAESSPNASMAVQLQRDYVYESDIRELDIDGFGKYEERTWGVPIGLGVRTKIAGGVDLKMGTSIHMSFSDLIDGVTDESLGNRTGDSKNDMFLYSSFSIGYMFKTGVRIPKEREVGVSPDLLAYLTETEDEDQDKVTDYLDQSPFTPLNTEVDENGVPIDSDGDGVFDYLDEEPNTEPGAAVHPNGVTISDEEFLLAYQIFMDSTGAFAAIAHSMAESSGDVPARRRPKKRNFVVQVGSEFEGIAPNMVDRILGLPDVRSVDLGDTTYLVVGNYTSLPNAIRRQMELTGKGVPGAVMEETPSGLRDVSSEVNALLPLDAAPSTTDAGYIIRVQLGAFRFPLSKDIFSDVNDLVVLNGEDGLTRYYSGNFKDIQSAAIFKVNKLLEGFDGAFMVAFKDGRRVSLSEVGGTLTRPESFDIAATKVDKSRVNFRILLGAFTGEVPAEKLEMFITLGKTRPVRDGDAIKYIHGKFPTRAEAESQLEKVKELGLKDAEIIGDFNGTLIDATEADRLLEQ
jgi:hypothetical protein